MRRHRFLRRVISHYTFADPSAWRVGSDYDFARATHDNYEAPVEAGYVGRLAGIRERLDAMWHGNYICERQRWQDAAVHAVALPADAAADMALKSNRASRVEQGPSDSGKCAAPTSRPWLVYTMGPMGAGKGYCMNYMSQCDILPLRQIVHIDPDRFKQMM